MLLAASDACDVLSLFGVQRTAHAHREQLGVAADGVERRAELVTHAGEKLGFRLARGPRFLFCSFALLDIYSDPHPGIDVPSFVPTGPTSRQEPAVGSVFMP